MPITKQELAEELEILKNIRGRQTELITVYVPEGYDVNSVQKQLEAEKSTAKNIKSSATRKNVGDALDKIIRHLKNFGRGPPNGLAIFCGNVSVIEGQQDLQLWSIEPPLPIKVKLYRCDKGFVTEPLEKMLEVDSVFGLLVMDRKEATIGVLEGKRIEVLQHMTSGVPSKIKAGGQSSQRFSRIIEGLTKEFYKRISEEMKKIFYNMPKLKGILVGGPIPTKDEFLDEEYLPTKLQELVIGRQDLGYADSHGLELLVEQSQNILRDQEITQEKQLLQRFFDLIGGSPDKAVYKEEDIRKALKFGAVETLIISQDADKVLAKELKKQAEQISSEVKMVSTETEEGRQFLNISGIGAILRFKV